MGDCACHANELKLGWNGDGPAFAFLELTPVCNNACIGCGNVFAARRATRPLSGLGWVHLIESIRPHIRWLKLTGGEPTLHPEFGEIVTFLAKHEIPFRLLTNGRWSFSERTLTLLRNNPALESLLISLHGPDAASHEAFTGVPGSFDEAIATIQQATTAGLIVATSTVITCHNWDRVADMVAFARSLGADHAVFNRYIGTPLPSIEANPVQEQQALRCVGALIARQAVRLGTPLPYCFLPSNNAGCLAGEAFVTVDPWGNVRPCNHAPLVLGNLLTQPLEEILCSEAMQQWRRMAPAPCQDCPELARCHGGCRAEMMLRGLGQDPLMCASILQLPSSLVWSKQVYDSFATASPTIL